MLPTLFSLKENYNWILPIYGGGLNFAMSTHAQPQKCKTGLFFEDECESWDSWLGVTNKVHVFKKNVFFFHFLLQIYSCKVRGYFQTKSCIRGKNWWQNCTEFLSRGVFPQNHESLLRYILKTPGQTEVEMHCINHTFSLKEKVDFRYGPFIKYMMLHTAFIYSCPLIG